MFHSVIKACSSTYSIPTQILKWNLLVYFSSFLDTHLLTAGTRLIEFVQHLIKTETTYFLARRKFFER